MSGTSSELNTFLRLFRHHFEYWVIANNTSYKVRENEEIIQLFLLSQGIDKPIMLSFEKEDYSDEDADHFDIHTYLDILIKLNEIKDATDVSEGKVMTLLEYIVQFVNDYDHKTTDIEWVGSMVGSHCMTWNDFIEIANVDFDPRYESKFRLPVDFVVVGKNWWLSTDYHGEELMYNEYPEQPDEMNAFKNIVVDVEEDDEEAYETIEELNE